MNDSLCYAPEFLEGVAKLARAISEAEREVGAGDIVDLYIRGPIKLQDGSGDTDHGHLSDVTDSSDWYWFPPAIEAPAPPPPRTMTAIGELVLPGSSEHVNGLHHPVQEWAEPNLRDEDRPASTDVEADNLPEGMPL